MFEVVAALTITNSVIFIAFFVWNERKYKKIKPLTKLNLGKSEARLDNLERKVAGLEDRVREYHKKSQVDVNRLNCVEGECRSSKNKLIELSNSFAEFKRVMNVSQLIK